MKEEYEVRSDIFYTKEHTWAEVATDGTVRVGITDYAQKRLGEIVSCELPSIGDEVKQMEPVGSIESLKAISDVYSPISGKVKKVNRELISKPGLANSDPYGAGWMLIIYPNKLEKELGNLLTPESYRNMIKGSRA